MYLPYVAGYADAVQQWKAVGPRRPVRLVAERAAAGGCPPLDALLIAPVQRIPRVGENRPPATSFEASKWSLPQRRPRS